VEAMRAGHELERGRAFGAETAAGGGEIRVAFNIDDMARAHVDILSAARGALGLMDFTARSEDRVRGSSCSLQRDLAESPRAGSVKSLIMWRFCFLAQLARASGVEVR